MPTFNLAEVKREKAEKHEPITIDLGDDETVTIPHVMCWGDDALEFANTDPVRMARIVLGDQYDRFHAAGGSATDLAHIVEQVNGASLGE